MGDRPMVNRPPHWMGEAETAWEREAEEIGYRRDRDESGERWRDRNFASRGANEEGE